MNSKSWNNNCRAYYGKIKADKAKLRAIGGRKATGPATGGVAGLPNSDNGDRIAVAANSQSVIRFLF
jgi:hypothetical protein